MKAPLTVTSKFHPSRSHILTLFSDTHSNGPPTKQLLPVYLFGGTSTQQMKYPCSHYQDVSLTSCGDTMVSTANQATAECVVGTKILCFDFMTTLFEPPNFVFGRQYNSNPMYPWSSSSSSSSSPSDKENKSSNSNYSTSLTPKRVCKMWKKKRKTEKMKLRELQQQEQRQDTENRDHDKVDIVSDFQLASETKQSAQQIQRRFEKKFDQNNYSQRHERYGNLVDFTPGLRKVKSSVPHL